MGCEQRVWMRGGGLEEQAFLALQILGPQPRRGTSLKLARSSETCPEGSRLGPKQMEVTPGSPVLTQLLAKARDPTSGPRRWRRIRSLPRQDCSRSCICCGGGAGAVDAQRWGQAPSGPAGPRSHPRNTLGAGLPRRSVPLGDSVALGQALSDPPSAPPWGHSTENPQGRSVHQTSR